MKKKILILAAILTFTSSLFAQLPTYYLSPEKKLYQYNLRSWSTNDGLPTNSLLSICQSKSGHLWIGSYDGLIRFDGQEFKTFHQYNTKNLNCNTVRGIAESDDGTLWLATQGSGLVMVNNSHFTTYGSEQGINSLYRAIYIDKEQRIWAASPEKGWFTFKDGQFEFIEDSYKLKDLEIRDIVQDSQGTFWFATLGSGLFSYKEGKINNLNTENGLVNNWVYSIYPDYDSKLWLGTNNGICTYDGKNFHLVDINNIGAVNDIIEDAHGNLWFSSTTGLFRIQSETGKTEHLNADKGLKHNYINDITLDKEGTLWMANYKGGLSQLKDGKFTNYTAMGGLHGKVVNAICELDKDKYLVAFDNGRLSVIEQGNISKFHKVNLTGKRIRNILKDSKGNLWFSTYSGLLKLNINGVQKWYTKSNGFPDEQVRVAFEDSEGYIWVGTRNRGLVKMLPGNTFKIFDISNGLTGNLIMSIGETNDQRLLVGTSEGDGGLSILTNNKITHTYAKGNGLTSNIVFGTYTDTDNNIWIAAKGGLNLLVNGEITSFTMNNGLLADTPFDILEDTQNNLWLPCNKGILKVSKSNLLTRTKSGKTPIKCSILNQYDGMHQQECNPTSKSVAAKDGTFLFPTIDGVSQINPTNVQVNNFIPPIDIKKLVADDKTIENMEDLNIGSDVKRLIFHFTALTLYEPQRVEFKYQLEGFEDHWVDAGKNRSVSYTNLSPGHYKFKVIGCNNDGVWNLIGASLPFHIKPNFYETTIFYILVILIFIALTYFAYKLRLVKLKKQKANLEKQVKNRTLEILEKNKELERQKNEITNQATELENQQKELKIANSTKDKMFSIIGHDLRGPLGNFRSILDIILNEPEMYSESEKEEMLLLLSENAKSTYSLLENLLNWSISQQGRIKYEPQHLTIRPIINDILSTVMPMAVKNEISILNQIEETLEVYADENMTRLIFRNLISNAIKFTKQKGKVRILAKQNSQYIEFGVSDTGIGIAKEMQEKLFDQLANTLKIGPQSGRGSGLGLVLCKEFVTRNGGKMRVESTPGLGCTFFFTLKKHA